MTWYQVFEDGPEYERRKTRQLFRPADVKLKDVHDAVPKHLFERSTLLSLLYITQHLLVTFAFYLCATQIDVLSLFIIQGNTVSYLITRKMLHSSLWIMYWGWQGFAFAGIWCLGHEAGHDALSPHHAVNAVAGMLLHSFVLTPYYAWRATHRAHHKGTNHMERDETYMPPTRKDFKLPDGKIAVRMDYTEVLEETPAFTLFKLLIRQFFGFQLYLLHNRKGNQKYPAWTSHFVPSSPLFKPEQRRSIIWSNIGIGAMICFLSMCARQSSWGSVTKYYFMPWLFQHNWMVMFTYLQHSDPTIPYYRDNEWTFARGALATIDRPLFGWVGRYLLHNISSDHLAHHFFASVPFYNLPEVTKAIKPVLGDYYNYDSTGVLRALWRSFTQCTFVDDGDAIVFFRNQRGESLLEVDPEYKRFNAIPGDNLK